VPTTTRTGSKRIVWSPCHAWAQAQVQPPHKPAKSQHKQALALKATRRLGERIVSRLARRPGVPVRVQVS
jgi:hypothetical protein